MPFSGFFRVTFDVVICLFNPRLTDLPYLLTLPLISAARTTLPAGSRRRAHPASLHGSYVPPPRLALGALGDQARPEATNRNGRQWDPETSDIPGREG